MNILIADDEPLQREKLARLIRESGLGFERVDACSNAPEALRRVEPYEILLTDICMPEMDGTELARRVRERYPEKVIVLISGHEDFEYAHAGIEAQVYDYILKPVDPARTLRCIAGARDHYLAEKNRREQYVLFSRFMEEHLNGMRRQFVESLLLYPEDADAGLVARRQALFHMDFRRYRLAVCRCVSRAAQGEEAYYFAYQAVRLVQELEPDWVALSIGGVVYMVTPLGDEPPPDEDVRLMRRLNQIVARLRRELRQPFHVAVSNPSDDLRELIALKPQASLCLERMAGREGDDLLFYADIDPARRRTTHLSFELERLSTCVRAGNGEAARAALGALTRSASGRGQDLAGDVAQLIFSQLLLALKEEGVADEKLLAGGEALMRARRADEAALSAFVDRACEAIRDMQSAISNQLIAQVYEYVNRHYAEPIGLNDAAAHVRRTPAYISRLFSQCTHATFTRALTEKRVAEAKRLLGDTSLSVADVALRTGYPNVRYFYRVFQTQVGMTANDYRKVLAAFGEPGEG